MNGIALFTLLLATTAQLGANAAPADAQYGWKIEPDGSLSYIAQVTPATASEMALRGEEIAVSIPDFLQGSVKQVVWRIGTLPVERDPSEAELRANPRQVLPRGSSLAPGSLSTLSDRTGMTVPIDPVRVSGNPIQTAATNRLSDGSSGIDAPPQLVQNFSTNGSRSNLNNAFDSTRNGVGGSGFSGIPTMPTNSQTLPPNNNLYTYTNSNGFVGPTLPPGYTGSNITISGTPTNTYGNTSTAYGSNSNYNATNAWNNTVRPPLPDTQPMRRWRVVILATQVTTTTRTTVASARFRRLTIRRPQMRTMQTVLRTTGPERTSRRLVQRCSRMRIWLRTVIRRVL